MRLEDWFDEDETALRIFRNFSGRETALYGYFGYWKSPGGMDAGRGKPFFPRLSVYGASLRSAVFRGIGNIEAGYYHSRDDEDGDDPLVNNSQFRFLAGYEQELLKELTGGVQYYLEHMYDHDDYGDGLADDTYAAEKNRQVVTLRLTKFLMNQDLALSFFSYYSPSDSDYYMRPKVTLKMDDRWTAELGYNAFAGDQAHTFFAQFEKNTNAYFSIRCAF